MRLLVLFTIPAVVGCGVAVPDTAVVMVRDSAGIEIVETTATTLRAASWTLASAPSVSIGQTDGSPEFLFSRIVGVLRLVDGGLVIGDGGSGELRFFSDRGAFLDRQGRPGEGPGEFEYMRALGRCGTDGFIAFDLNWQMNGYAEDGTFIEKRQFVAPDGGTPYNLACDEHLHFVVLGWGIVSGTPIGFYETHGRLVLSDFDSEIAAEFGDWLVSERLGTEGGSRPHPFGRATVFDLHEDYVYVGTGERFQVHVYDLDGRLVRVMHGPAIPLEITEALRAEYLESVLRNTPDEQQIATRVRISAMGWPESRPAFTALRVDPLGVVWLRQFQIDDADGETWSLLDPAEGYLGDLELPMRHSLLSLGVEEVILLAYDELGVEQVRVYGLNRER